MSETKRALPIDPEDLKSLIAGLLLGVALIAVLSGIGLMLGLTAAIQFGVPHV